MLYLLLIKVVSVTLFENVFFFRWANLMRKRVMDFSEEVSRIGLTSQVGRVLLGFDEFHKWKISIIKLFFTIIFFLFPLCIYSPTKEACRQRTRIIKMGFYSRSLIFRLQSKKIFWFWFHFPIEKGTRGLLFRFIISLFNSLKFELSLIPKKKKKKKGFPVAFPPDRVLALRNQYFNFVCFSNENSEFIYFFDTMGR